jgi:sarcosine oxidase, subunit beta
MTFLAYRHAARGQRRAHALGSGRGGVAETRRVDVVGGGALGASAALALAGDGHHVTLHERGTLLSATSSKAAGILSTLCHSDAEYRLIAETRGLLGEAISLALATGERAAKGAWRSHPSLVVGHGDSLATLDAMQGRAERFTEEVERLDHRQAARMFPGVRFEPGEECIVAQEDGVIEAGDFAVALRARLDAEGVEVREGQAMRGPGNDLTVVAGGAWTKGWLARHGVALPVQMYRTQLTSLALPGGGDLPIVHDLRHHFYTRPESDDSFLAGDGTQLRPFDPDDYNEAADPEFVESIAARVVARFDDGAEARVRSGWAGLCVATPDRRPLCGAVPGHAGLFVLTGDNGFGLMRSLALGQRLADAVAGRIDPALDPARLAGQSGEFQMREGYGTG